jgi:3-deoxy-manno-octulosonate cytidylyltransferase (CMP-KDO synthetase)
MKVIGVIPARFGSTRLPGKPLKDLCGKSVLQRVYENALQAKSLDDVIVACDDERVINEVSRFGGKAVMTAISHPNGSSRAAEVVKDLDVDFVINIQGDEPFVSPDIIDELADLLLSDKELYCATLCTKVDAEEYGNPNVVKVVRNLKGDALYFSRSLIPYQRNEVENSVFEHVGMYGYSKDFLITYADLTETPLSEIESLEQLKVLEHGFSMRVFETKHAYNALSIDTDEDLEKAREIVSAAQKIKSGGVE